jgi:hypothetical protein
MQDSENDCVAVPHQIGIANPQSLPALRFQMLVAHFVLFLAVVVAVAV